MPHTTHAYPFEAKVGQLAGEVSARFTSNSSLRSFLLVLTSNGDVTSLIFEDGKRDWRDTRANEAEGVPHLLYDPVDDGMEYTWLSWHCIERTTMERLVGQCFEDADFVPIPIFMGRARELNPDKQFPQTWGVMF